jgi:hypothetical protein
MDQDLDRLLLKPVQQMAADLQRDLVEAIDRVSESESEGEPWQELWCHQSYAGEQGDEWRATWHMGYAFSRAEADIITHALNVALKADGGWGELHPDSTIFAYQEDRSQKDQEPE